MKKILITGSNGLIGRSIADMFCQIADYKVYGISSGINRSASPSLEFVRADITDNNFLIRTLKEISPDIIIHTAAMGSPDMCEQNRVEAWKVNVDATGAIAEYCRNNRVYLLHWSSDFVFDGMKGNYTEDNEPNPVSYYGLTKLESEKAVIDLCPDACIFRTILVYGLFPVMTRQNILSRVLQAAEKNSPMNIAADQYRMPTYIKDLAIATRFSIEKNAKGIYHVSGNDYMSVYDFVMKIATVFGLPAGLFHSVSSYDLNEKAKRPPKTGFVLDKAISELGYSPTALSDALQEIRGSKKVLFLK